MVSSRIKKLLDVGAKLYIREGNLSLTASCRKDTESMSTEVIVVLRRENGVVMPADLEWAEKELRGRNERK